MAFKITTQHQKIRQWIEKWGGRPVVIRGTENNLEGILQIDFEYPALGLEAVEWEEFFDRFDTENLAFVFDDAALDKSLLERSFRFVDRDTVGADVSMPDNAEIAEENTFPSSPSLDES